MAEQKEPLNKQTGNSSDVTAFQALGKFFPLFYQTCRY